MEHFTFCSHQQRMKTVNVCEIHNTSPGFDCYYSEWYRITELSDIVNNTDEIALTTDGTVFVWEERED